MPTAERCRCWPIVGLPAQMRLVCSPPIWSSAWTRCDARAAISTASSTRRCGRQLSCEIHPLPDQDLFHVYLSDITEHKRAEQKLMYQAYHDALTDLPNRHEFHERLSQAISAQASGAVLLLNLDRFRLFVDSFGHNVGDEVLKAVAARLNQTLQGSWSEFLAARLFRMDGARFAVFAPGVRSPATLDALAQRMQESAREPIRVRDRDLLLSFSVGGSLFPLDGRDAETVVQRRGPGDAERAQAGRQRLPAIRQRAGRRVLRAPRAGNGPAARSGARRVCTCTSSPRSTSEPAR